MIVEQSLENCCHVEIGIVLALARRLTKCNEFSFPEQLQI
jgi:hypothetical protein